MDADNQITISPKTIPLAIDKIRIDGNTQYRIVIDQPTVYNYRDAIKKDDELPLIDVVYDGEIYWLTDGFHRYHAFKLLGIREIQVNCIDGCLRDAQIEALKANCQHGKPLTNDDKRNKVQMALKIDGFAGKSDRELAKICNVSAPLVSSIRDPKVKARQKENIKKHFAKNISSPEGCNLITPTEAIQSNGAAPDDDEIKASELAMQAYLEEIEMIMESDDKLSTANERIKKLSHLNAQMEIRFHGLMNEKNECVKMVKQLQKENDRLRKAMQTIQNDGSSNIEVFRGH